MEHIASTPHIAALRCMSCLCDVFMPVLSFLCFRVIAFWGRSVEVFGAFRGFALGGREAALTCRCRCGSGAVRVE
jgi:hypothetical protein